MRKPLAALALCIMLASAPALADDPNDPAMRSAAARARDRAIIRQLNRNQLAHVRARDAAYARGWQAYRDYPAQLAEVDRRNAEIREENARRMAEWRHAVSACRSGRTEYCAR
ncbi:MAG: hypothetical protein KGL44_09655 [Sphingomonadales bacterium]|nr:hypothetical protein [Sphingomonadales bacterium]